jgi:hypothetical protein
MLEEQLKNHLAVAEVLKRKPLKLVKIKLIL